MANECDQTDDSANEVPEIEPAFCFADFTFEDATNQGTYNQFQKQATIRKQTYTKFVKDGIKEITTQSKAPKMQS